MPGPTLEFPDWQHQGAFDGNRPLFAGVVTLTGGSDIVFAAEDVSRWQSVFITAFNLSTHGLRLQLEWDVFDGTRYWVTGDTQIDLAASDFVEVNLPNSASFLSLSIFGGSPGDTIQLAVQANNRKSATWFSPVGTIFRGTITSLAPGSTATPLVPGCAYGGVASVFCETFNEPGSFAILAQDFTGSNFTLFGANLAANTFANGVIYLPPMHIIGIVKNLGVNPETFTMTLSYDMLDH